MILILGSDTFEQGTNPVIDWLIHYKANFLKLTASELFSKEHALHVDVDTQKIYYKGHCLNDEVSAIFYRHYKGYTSAFTETEHKFSNQINNELHTELEVLTEYLYESLKDKKWYSRLPSIHINKLSMLNSAKQVGLAIPKSKILTTREAVELFLNERSSKKLIIKQFSDRSRGYFTDADYTYFSFVKGFSPSDIAELPESFVPTLFQEKIQIQYEIRVFYLEEQFFATAILMDKYSETDDRKQIMDHENVQTVPYQLPKKIEDTICVLMKDQNLPTGSLDLIKDIHGNYCFLEVNPIGQYLFESNKCNSHIAKKIAEHLIKQDKAVVC